MKRSDAEHLLYAFVRNMTEEGYFPVPDEEDIEAFLEYMQAIEAVKWESE